MHLPVDLSEAEFQETVIEVARLTGWRIYHARPAQVRPGKWVTAFTGDAGFPDLLLAHDTRGVLFAELKTDRGHTSPEQEKWLFTLRAAGAEAHLWRPRDMETILDRLQGHAP
jgi:hypothetical protein